MLKGDNGRMFDLFNYFKSNKVYKEPERKAYSQKVKSKEIERKDLINDRFVLIVDQNGNKRYRSI